MSREPTSLRHRRAGPTFLMLTLALGAGLGAIGFMVGAAWTAQPGAQQAGKESALAPPDHEVAPSRRALRDVQRRLHALERRQDRTAEEEPTTEASPSESDPSAAPVAEPKGTAFADDTPEIAERQHQAELAAFRETLTSVETQPVDAAWAPHMESAIAEETVGVSGVEVAVACRTTLCRLDVAFATQEGEQEFAKRTMEMPAFRDTSFVEHLIRDEHGRVIRSEIVLARSGHELPSMDVSNLDF